VDSHGTRIAKSLAGANWNKSRGRQAEQFFCFPEPPPTLMRGRQIENDDVIIREPKMPATSAIGIPIDFGLDFPVWFPVKIQPRKPMNQPIQTTIPEKPLIPSLFQIAAFADDVKSVSALKNALAHNRVPLPDMMLNRDRIEAVLKALLAKKKAGARRIGGTHLDKELR